MTYQEYLDSTNDAFERVVIMVNLARKCNPYLSPRSQKAALKKMLAQEMPEIEGEPNERSDR